jgi:hypothetical protein
MKLPLSRPVIHPVIHLFTSTRATTTGITIAGAMATDHNHLVAAIMEAQNSPSFFLFFGGFVFVATTVVAQTQHTDRDKDSLKRGRKREEHACTKRKV